MFKDIILSVTKEVLVSQGNERPLSNGGMGEDYIKESMEIKTAVGHSLPRGRNKEPMLGSE